MSRNRFDAASLLAGLLFLAFSGLYLAAGFGGLRLPLTVIGPALLIGLGVVGLVRIATRSRRRDP